MTNIQTSELDYKKFGRTDVLMLLVTLLWGVNFSFVKIGLRELAPFGFNGFRLLLASSVLILILVLSGESFKVDRKTFGNVLILGLLGNTAYQMFFIHGINLTTASNTAIILAMTPVFIALISSLTKYERIHTATWAGILLSFVGFYLVISSRFGTFQFSSQSLRGDLLILSGNICWALYTVFSKPLLGRISPLKLTTLTMTLGTIFYLPFCVKDILRIPYSEVSTKTWMSIVYSGLFALVIGYVIWYASLRRVGSTKTAIYVYLIPIFAVIFASFILGERIMVQQGIGALIIFLGVYLARIGYAKYINKEKN
jgi:drug/metabolite transporter (DMT)-like permease